VAVFGCLHREFFHKSAGERILKIGPHLPKLLSNIKGYTFLGHSVDRPNNENKNKNEETMRT